MPSFAVTVRRRRAGSASAPAALACALVLAALVALAACGGDEAPAGELGALEPHKVPRLPCEGAEVRDGDARMPIGFNDASYIERWGVLEDAVAMHRALGSTLMRYSMDWKLVEPEPGSLALTRFDAAYCAAVEAGIRPLIILFGVPDWAAEQDIPCARGECLAPPRSEHLADFARYARLAAERYPEAAAFEVWNEPNFFRYFGMPDPERYTEILEAAHAGVKQGNPEATVLGGALTNNPNDEPENGSLSLRTFLTGMYEAGAEQHMDALSLHTPPTVPLDDPRQQLDPALAVARELNESLGGGSMPIWITETGMATAPGIGWSPAVPKSVQTETMLEVLHKFERARDVKAVTFHALLEAPGQEFGFAWVDRRPGDGYEPKPVFCRVASTREAPGCSAPVFRRGR